jgi:hypothetical protein
MERVLVGVRINNADTNEVWKPRLDHGNFFEALEHLFLSFFLDFFANGRSWSERDCPCLHRACHAPTITMWCELAPSFYESHLTYQAIKPTYRYTNRYS